MIVAFAWGVCLVTAGAGCAFGPKVLEKSHGRHNEAIRLVDEEQLLRNLVHVRYNEAPYRLAVSSIAAQYELAGSAEARPFFDVPNQSGPIFRTFTKILPDVAVSGANRPTITLIPPRSDSIRRFLTPISVDTLVFLQSTSWPIATVMRLWVERLNGVPNAPSASGPQREFAPDFARFHRIAYLLQVAQDLELASVDVENRDTVAGGPLPTAFVTASAAVDAAKNGLEYRPNGDGSTWSLIRKEHHLVIEVNPLALEHPAIVELVNLLNLEPGRLQYNVVVASNVRDPLRSPNPPSLDLSVTTRSTAQVYFFLANGVEVPADHIAAGMVRPAVGADGRPFDGRAVTAGLFEVHASKGHKPPATAFVAVKYRDYWYYIDDRDQATKTTFALVLQLAKLDFGLQEPTGGPFLTLPVGR